MRSACILAATIEMALVPTMALASARAYIVNRDDRTISVINTTTERVVATVSVDEAPAAIAVSADGHTAYFSQTQSASLGVVDASTNAISKVIPMPGPPFGVLADKMGAIYVVIGTQPVQLVVVDAERQEVSAQVSLGDSLVGLQAFLGAVSPDGALIVVPLLVDSEMYPCLITPLGCRVHLQYIDTAAKRLVNTFFLPDIVSSPGDVSFAPPNLGVYLERSVSSSGGDPILLGDASGRGVGVQCSRGLALDADRSRVLSCSSCDGTVSVIDTVTNTLSDTIAVGVAPAGISVAMDGSTAYVLNSGSNSVSVIDLATLRVRSTIEVGRHPSSHGRFIGPDVFDDGTPTSRPVQTETPTPTAAPKSETPVPTASETASPGAPKSGGCASAERAASADCNTGLLVPVCVFCALFAIRRRARRPLS